jgi:uncharacterized Tic20 family protein
MSAVMPAPAPQHGPSQPRPMAMPSQRLRVEGLSDSDRNFALTMHLSPLAGLLVWPLVCLPLVLWLVKKDESVFADDHGREVVNMLLTGLVVWLLNITIIWFPISLVWTIFIFSNMIRGAVAASNGEYFRYPMVFRFLS